MDVPPNINESILSELPEEIRNEILNAQKNKNSDTEINNREADNAEISKINEGKSQRLVQTHTENFFKQTKPGIPKQTKVEMPPIQEIDMSVLIELPEEIRNEILNEYSTKRNQDKTNVNTRENVGSIARIRANCLPGDEERERTERARLSGRKYYRILVAKGGEKASPLRDRP